MIIRFIGTGSGETSLKRFHSSIIFSDKNYKLLVDAGDGISKALLTQKIPYNSINGILISHLHPDHYSGLSSLIIQMKIAKRKSNLEIFIHRSLSDTVKDFIFRSYIFNERMSFKIIFREFDENKFIRVSKDLNFKAKQNSHLERYRIYDRKKLLSFSCSSFLFNYRGKNIFYTGDAGSSKDLYLFEKEKISLIISETSHIKFPEISKAIQNLGAKRIYLTHISDKAENSLSKSIISLPEESSRNFVIAYDGMTISI